LKDSGGSIGFGAGKRGKCFSVGFLLEGYWGVETKETKKTLSLNIARRVNKGVTSEGEEPHKKGV